MIDTYELDAQTEADTYYAEDVDYELDEMQRDWENGEWYEWITEFMGYMDS